MDIAEVQASLLDGPRFAVKDLPQELKASPGIYAMFVDDASSLPSFFGDEMRRRESDLIYLGQASKTILGRCYEEELLHKRAATFFRSVGAMLEYRPEAGSLFGKKNQSNYRFTKSDTESIKSWLRERVTVSCVYMDASEIDAIEGSLIGTLSPLLSIQGNSSVFQPLSDARTECREIARRPIHV